MNRTLFTLFIVFGAPAALLLAVVVTGVWLAMLGMAQ